MSRLVLFCEVDGVGRLVEVLGQVENVELLALVNDKELAHAGHVLPIVVTSSICIIEVQQAPRQLHDRVVASLVPDRDRVQVFIMVQSTKVGKAEILTQLSRM